MKTRKSLLAIVCFAICMAYALNTFAQDIGYKFVSAPTYSYPSPKEWRKRKKKK